MKFAGLQDFEIRDFVRNGEIDQLSQLLNKGLDVNFSDRKTGVRMLHLAVQHDHPDIVRLLLRHGADLTSKEIGNTPVDWAKSFGRRGIAHILREHIRKSASTAASLP